jgi:hypothetical protein
MIAAAIAELNELAVDDDPATWHIDTTNFKTPQCEAIGRPSIVKRHPDWHVVFGRFENANGAGDKLTISDAASGACVGEVFHRSRIAAQPLECPRLCLPDQPKPARSGGCRTGRSLTIAMNGHGAISKGRRLGLALPTSR